MRESIVKIKVGIAAVLTLAMAAFGVGCTPPANDWEANNQAVSVGNFFLFLILVPLCANNGPNCPIPGDPVGPQTTVAPPVDPPVIPAPEVPVSP